MIETLTANYAELNPEINSEDENMENSSFLEDSSEETSNIEDNSPVDGNMNLFDNM